MSTLLLIRHGQARAFEADSDRLTPRGEEQARMIGADLLRQGIEIDEVYTGTLARQRRTAELAGDAFRQAGRRWPEPRAIAQWNEYSAEGILGQLLPNLATRDARFAELVTEFQERAGARDRNAHFQRMFEVLMAAWQTGSIESPDVEPFVGFHARVRTALRNITEGGGGRTVAVFTSGGPIGVCVQEAVEAPPRSALMLNWRVKNASITELLFSSNRISLETFNSVAHLPTELRTFR